MTPTSRTMPRTCRLAAICVVAVLAWPIAVWGQYSVDVHQWPASRHSSGAVHSRLAGLLPFHHSDPNDPNRYIGWGTPLQGTSWRNRPFHMGWDVGLLSGDELIKGHVNQGQRVMGAYRLGWDFDHYWGTEFRFAFAYLDAIDTQDPPVQRDARNLYWDGNLLYYPWGDAKWRPFASLGLGVANFRFKDDIGRSFNESLFEVPFGIGVKYQASNWIALRLDLRDNMAVSGSGLSTMHNVSITGGVEIRFGSRPTSYYPWSPGVHYR